MDSLVTDLILRLALAAGSFLVLLHPDNKMAMAAAAIVLPATIIGVWRHRLMAAAAPSPELQVQAAQ